MTVPARFFSLCLTVLAGWLILASACLAQSSSDTTNVLFITDRNPIMKEDGASSYGSERFHSISFGSIQVHGAVLAAPEEIGRFPATPYTLEKHSDHLERSASVLEEHRAAMSALKKEIARRASTTSRKEVVVFVHGYNNTFDDAVKSGSQLCNDLGQNDFVCVVFTWPAGGAKGALFGYNFDRESGEFCVPDLRKMLRAISQSQGVQKIHIIAHSRGTDVVASTLQQLSIEAYALKSVAKKKFKISTVIMAAPDMDIDVAYSRARALVSDPDLTWGGEANYHAPFDRDGIQLTIYTSGDDLALGTSQELFGSDARLGRVTAEDKGSVETLTDRAAGMAEYISVRNNGELIGHSYFLSDPAVRRDIVAVIRDHAKAGTEGRSLIPLKNGFWALSE